VAAALPVVLSLVAAGCVETTQQKSARAALVAERLLATRQAVVVTRPDASVTVAGVGLVRSAAGAAVAVVLHNDSPAPVSDLRISVGVKVRRGPAVYLNREPGLPYFETHVGAIPAGGQVTWVFAASHPITTAGTPFANVGQSTVPISAGRGPLPAVSAAVASVPSPAAGSGVVYARVTNHSSVPQDGLTTYAYAVSHGRLIAAGLASVASLDSGSSTTLPVSLIGNAGSATVRLDAPPTGLR
jgi:hypothetical protein